MQTVKLKENTSHKKSILSSSVLGYKSVSKKYEPVRTSSRRGSRQSSLSNLFRDDVPARVSLKTGETNKAMKDLNSQVSSRMKNKFAQS